MLNTLVKVIALLVVGILTYNYFFGSPAEQETSRQVVGQVRELGESVFDLLQSEKEKLSEGKYDEALANLKEAIGLQKQQAAALGHEGHESLERCDHLHDQQLALEQQLEAIQVGTQNMSQAEQDAALESIREQISTLTADAESLAIELAR